MNGVLLVLVDQRYGGGLKIHHRDQALKKAAAEVDALHQGGVGEIVLLLFIGTCPVPVSGVRHGDVFLPLVDIRHLGVAGLDHGAAGGLHKDPRDAEAVHPSAGAPGHVFGVAADHDRGHLAGGGDPHGRFALIEPQHIFARGNGRVVSVELEKPGKTADYLQLVRRELLNRHLHSSFLLILRSNGGPPPASVVTILFEMRRNGNHFIVILRRTKRRRQVAAQGLRRQEKRPENIVTKWLQIQVATCILPEAVVYLLCIPLVKLPREESS